MASEKVTLEDWALNRIGSVVGLTISEASAFLPLPVWATTGRGFALKITSIGLTVVTPKPIGFSDVENVPPWLGAPVDVILYGLGSAGEVFKVGSESGTNAAGELVISILVSSNDTNTIVSIEFTAGVADP